MLGTGDLTGGLLVNVLIQPGCSTPEHRGRSGPIAADPFHHKKEAARVGRPKSREETPKEGCNTEWDVRCCIAQ
jgi:hypothetical protein